MRMKVSNGLKPEMQNGCLNGWRMYEIFSVDTYVVEMHSHASLPNKILAKTYVCSNDSKPDNFHCLVPSI